MAFNLKNFQPIGGQARAGSAPQMFSYETQDAAADVDTANYFAPVRDALRIGDIIVRVTKDATGAVVTSGMHVVMARSATAVDVSDTTTIGVTNTD